MLLTIARHSIALGAALLAGCASAHERVPDAATVDAEAHDEVRAMLRDAFELRDRAEARYCECTGCESSPTPEAYIDCIIEQALLAPEPFLDYYATWITHDQMLLACYDASDCMVVADRTCARSVDADIVDALSRPPPPEVAAAGMRCEGL